MTSITIPAVTHGRYVIERPVGESRGLLVGFHGYAESAELHLERLKRIPGAGHWLLISIQGLHRFYRRSSGEVVASWMTKEDRELAISDNLAYIASILDAVSMPAEAGIVFAAFSQGVAAAVRAACALRIEAPRLILLGGEVPPEIEHSALAHISAVLIGRGRRDEALSESAWKRDVARFQDAGVITTPFEFDAKHEWTDLFATAASVFLNRASDPRTLSPSRT